MRILAATFRRRNLRIGFGILFPASRIYHTSLIRRLERTEGETRAHGLTTNGAIAKMARFT